MKSLFWAIVLFAVFEVATATCFVLFVSLQTLGPDGVLHLPNLFGLNPIYVFKGAVLTTLSAISAILLAPYAKVALPVLLGLALAADFMNYKLISGEESILQLVAAPYASIVLLCAASYLLVRYARTAFKPKTAH